MEQKIFLDLQKKRIEEGGGKGLYVGMVNIAKKFIGKKNMILFFKLDCTEAFPHGSIT